jgi:hypothetical protein
MSPTANTPNVVFLSDLFANSWPTGGEDPNYPPLGEDCANWLRAKLSDRSKLFVVGEPIDGSGGWTMFVQFAREEFEVFVHWAPIGQPPIDAWVIQIAHIRGLLGKLFSRHRKVSPSLELIISELNTILEAEPKIHDIQWLTSEDFRKVY